MAICMTDCIKGDSETMAATRTKCAASGCEKCQDVGSFLALKSNKPDTILISKEDFEKLLDHIENPPEPTEAFKKAMKRYKDMVKK